MFNAELARTHRDDLVRRADRERLANEAPAPVRGWFRSRLSRQTVKPARPLTTAPVAGECLA
jgi:hypothetical protein